MDISLQNTAYATEDLSWLGSAHGQDSLESITLDVSAFTEGTHYPNGFFPSGIALGKITATGLYGPYATNVSEIQTLTIDATGGTYTPTFDGEAAAAITYANTTGDTATLQAALLAMSCFETGDVVVTRGTTVGTETVFTLTFGGRYLGENVPAFTCPDSLTGGAGTAVVGTGTGGGSASSNGQETFAGFLARTVDAPAVNTTDVGASLMTHGVVIEANLPSGHGLDAAAKVSNGAKNLRFR